MEVGLVLLALLLVAIAALLLPVNLTFSLQARGDPNGGYAAAGGAGLGPLSVACLAARELPSRFELFVFGKKLRTGRLGEKAKRLRSPDRTSFFSRVDPFELLVFLLDERRRIALCRMDVRVDYSFSNVATTGQLLAALCALSALLPERVHFEQHPSWQLESRASLTLDGRIRLWPGRLMLDTLWFLGRRRMLAWREASPALPAGPR